MLCRSWVENVYGFFFGYKNIGTTNVYVLVLFVNYVNNFLKLDDVYNDQSGKSVVVLTNGLFEN